MAIFGPPGTGKTQTLVGLASEFITENMAVLSFTRSGAKELVERVTVRPRFVGTIHALCFKHLNLTRRQVADPHKFFSWILGYQEHINLALQFGNLSIKLHRTMEECISMFSEEVYTPPIHILEFYWQSYMNWKKDYGLMDFDDMILRCIGKIDPFDVVIVDEAQDLSPIQWELINSIVSSKLIVAGDDDQSIYTWAGAQPLGMLELNAREIILAQSYRVPKEVYKLAQATINNISLRKQKKYFPTPEDGYVQWNNDFQISNLQADTSILCRDQYIQQRVEDEIIFYGLPYRLLSPYRFGWFENIYADLIRAIHTDDIEFLEKHKQWLSPRGKEMVEDGHMPDWRYAMNASMEMMHYFDKVDLFIEPDITLSTIHAQKGRETDHVILYTECSSRTENLQDKTATRDDEIRVWYVGLTRAKKGVTLVNGINAYIQT